MRVSSRRGDRGARLSNTADRIDLPRGMKSSAFIPSRFANLVVIVLIIDSFVQSSIEISPLCGRQARIGVSY